MTTADPLPEDMPSLRAVALALIAERDELLHCIERMHHIIRQFQRAQFGRHSERLDSDQLQLALEEREIARAQEQAAAEKQATALHPKSAPGARKSLPAHLPRVEVVIEPETTSCPRPRYRCRELGLSRLADRNLQAEWRRSASLSHRCAGQTCQSLAG
jgi:hypothetical protein